MTDDLIIPSKACPICHCRFTPKRTIQVTCGRRPCRNRWASKQRKALGSACMAAAIEGRKQARDAAIKAELKDRFGDLSDREVQLFKYIYKTAWQRGYNARMLWEKRRGIEVGREKEFAA